MNGDTVIDLQAVSKYYDAVLAVDEVSFTIDGGAICALPGAGAFLLAFNRARQRGLLLHVGE